MTSLCVTNKDHEFYFLNILHLHPTRLEQAPPTTTPILPRRLVSEPGESRSGRVLSAYTLRARHCPCDGAVLTWLHDLVPDLPCSSLAP